jgi:hypothetical protein
MKAPHTPRLICVSERHGRTNDAMGSKVFSVRKPHHGSCVDGLLNPLISHARIFNAVYRLLVNKKQVLLKGSFCITSRARAASPCRLDRLPVNPPRAVA